MADEKIKILLAEDDENLGSLLKEYLKAKSFDADWVTDGEMAFKKFEAGSYDICILDVMMPVKDGFTLAKEIRMMNRETGDGLGREQQGKIFGDITAQGDQVGLPLITATSL